MEDLTCVTTGSASSISASQPSGCFGGGGSFAGARRAVLRLMVLCLATAGRGAFLVGLCGRVGVFASKSEEDSDSEVELVTVAPDDTVSEMDVLRDVLEAHLPFVAGVAGDFVEVWLRLDEAVSFDTAAVRCLDIRAFTESLEAVTELI